MCSLPTADSPNAARAEYKRDRVFVYFEEIAWTKTQLPFRVTSVQTRQSVKRALHLYVTLDSEKRIQFTTTTQIHCTSLKFDLLCVRIDGTLDAGIKGLLDVSGVRLEIGIRSLEVVEQGFDRNLLTQERGLDLSTIDTILGKMSV